MNSFIILISYISFLGTPNEVISSPDDRDFYYMFDPSDSLMYKEETKQRIDFFFCFNSREDTSPLLFTCQKNNKNNVEIIPYISSNKKIFNRKDFIKIANDFESYKKDKSIGDEEKIVYFPKWLGMKFDNFYILEKSGKSYKKYLAVLGAVEIDYILR